MTIQITQTVDARGLSCPMPIVKTARGHQDDPVRRILRGPGNRSGIGQGLRSLVAIDPERDRRAIRGRRRLPLRPDAK